VIKLQYLLAPRRLIPRTGFDSDFTVFSNVSQHVLNTVFCLFEIFIPRTNPTPWIHLVPIIIILLLYLGLAYTTWGTEHFYVYDFLDDRLHSKGVIAGYILGILALAIVVFLIVHFVLLGRVKLTEEKWKKTGKFSTRGRAVGATDVEVTEVREEKALH
jgi:carbon starvation protein CstA